MFYITGRVRKNMGTKRLKNLVVLKNRIKNYVNLLPEQAYGPHATNPKKPHLKK